MKDAKRRKELALTALGLAAAAGLAFVAMPDDAEAMGIPGLPDTITLVGVVRDFQEPMDRPGGHPDFEATPTNGFGHYAGNIAAQLDADGKPVFAGGGRKVMSQWRDSASRNIMPSSFDPDLGDMAGSWGPEDSGGIHSAQSFSQWYRDTPGLNMSAPLSITLRLDADSQKYIFDDRTDPDYANLGGFFPINGQLLGNEANDDRNFHFTYELDTTFTYRKGAGDTFTFRGDDDVWVFIDGRKVIDLGGVHAAIQQTVHLDRLSWLQDGKDYQLKFFFAERHRTQSNFHMETTFPLRNGKLPTISGMYD